MPRSPAFRYIGGPHRLWNWLWALQPETRHVAVIAGSALEDLESAERFRREAALFCRPRELHLARPTCRCQTCAFNCRVCRITR